MAGKLSPVCKGRLVGFVDFLHLGGGEGEAVCDRRNGVDFDKREFPPLSRLQIFVEHLIATNVKVPHPLWHRLEGLRLVDH